MSRFPTKPNVLAQILDGISNSVSIRLRRTIDNACAVGGLWMQPQYLPVRIRNDAGRRATYRDRPR